MADKVATILLQEGFGFQLGPAIDSHGIRVPCAFGWIELYKTAYKRKQKISIRSLVPSKVKSALMDWLPEKYYCEFNHVVAGMGQLVKQIPQENVKKVHAAWGGTFSSRTFKQVKGDFDTVQRFYSKKVEENEEEIEEMEMAEIEE